MDNYFLFVGRISREKGIVNLVKAWLRYIEDYPEDKLFIVGEGPEKETIENIILENKLQGGVKHVNQYLNIELKGQLSRMSVLDYISDAKAVIIPSIWYEAGPMVVIESFSKGVPVICSDLGNLSINVEEAVTGAKFNPFDENEIVSALKRFRDYDTKALKKNCEFEYNTKYSREVNVALFKEIYEHGRAY